MADPQPGARLKIIVRGDTGTTTALLRLISAFIEGDH